MRTSPTEQVAPLAPHPPRAAAGERRRRVAGFLRLAIGAGVDIIVTYTYGLNDMYRTLEWRRHWRAVKAQEWGLPLVYWWGPLGKICGNVPYTEDVTVATFDPFPASKCGLHVFVPRAVLLLTLFASMA